VTRLDPDAQVSGRHQALVFTLTALGAFINSLDLSIVNVAYPSISRSFPGTSAAGLAWILTGYSIVFGSLLVVGGAAGARPSSPAWPSSRWARRSAAWPLQSAS
jgi:MFS family permease